jgi:hypothetical protein
MVATTTTATTATARPSVRPMSGDLLLQRRRLITVASSIAAIAPTSVRMPVAVTTARPVPCATAVPLNTMLRRSPSGVGRVRRASPSDGLAFARERRFLHAQRAGAQEPGIGAD